MTTKELYKIYLKHPVISTDTRKITDSCMFFALKGENFDANQFASMALENGAAYAVVDDQRYAVSDRYVLVESVLNTLQSLAAFHRDQLNIPIIGITGTNGKTTSKELVKAVLSQHYRTYATEGNLNNHIGVPLSLLSIQPDCDIAIIEMGANHQKEIEFLCRLAKPGYGLITNVGKAHLEGFGGVEGVKIAKGELYEHLSQTEGVAFINTDNSILVNMCRDRNVKNIISYGTDPSSYLAGRIKEVSPTLVVEWYKNGEEEHPPHLAESNLPGLYNFENILAAIAIGSFFKLRPEQINKGIKAYIPHNNRSQILKTERNTIICDFYNANPSSMTVALDNLEAIPARNKALILADMFELGVDAAIEHRLILEKAMETTSARRIFIGEEFYRMRDNVDAEFYQSTMETAEALKERPLINSTVLVKGSRGMKLEILVTAL
jgi:UDP-N-acetylmuramoyl-tripeptide--D-alanyl-D-alanine ligase